jgi:hypothetical protein
MRGIKAQFASCARKVAYKSAEEAARAGQGLGSYLCPICGRYHLTSSSPSRIKVEPIEEKSIFDRSVLSRARLAKPKSKPEPKTEIATCLAKPRPDGRVRLDVAGTEILSEPVQPAHLRSELGQSMRVQVRIAGDLVTVIGAADD